MATNLDILIKRNQKLMQQLFQRIRNDITGAQRRAADMEEFLAEIGINLNTNVVTGTNMAETLSIIESITQGFDLGSNLPIGGMREVYKQTAQDHTMDYVTKMGDDLKQSMRDIVSRDLAEGKSAHDIARDLEAEIDKMSRTRAELIARTETARAKELGQYYDAQEKGMNAFIVLSKPDCCQECEEEYVGMTFTMDEVDMLPPLHPNCLCTAQYYRTEDRAEEAASDFNDRWEEARDEIIESTTESAEGLVEEVTTAIEEELDKSYSLDGLPEDITMEYMTDAGEYAESNFTEYNFTNDEDNLTISAETGTDLPVGDVMNEYEKLPDQIKENIDEIIILNYDYNPESINPGGWHDPMDINKIYVTDIPQNVENDELFHVVSHEAGHSYESVDTEKNLGDETILDKYLDAAFKESTDESGFDYKYASEYSEWVMEEDPIAGPSEDFAESVSLYLADKESYQNDFPERFKLFEDLFG